MGADTAAQQSAALSNVQDSATSSNGAEATTADASKLGAAVSSMSLGDGKKAAATSAPAAAAQKPVKIDAADVAYIVEQLEVNKTKATDLLRASGGDMAAAIRAYVVPA